MNQPTLCINLWSETFENADTRKRERLKFFHCPSGCDSNGYLELMVCHQSAGLVAFGVFQALCQHSATLPAKHRGKFVKTNGSAMTLTQIALLIRVEPATLEKAVELLTDQSIGWLKWEHKKQESASNLPATCQSSPNASADILPPIGGFVQGQGQGQGEGQGEGEGKSAPARKASPPKPIQFPDNWEDDVPTEAAKDFTRLQARINDLHPSWKKRPHFSRLEQEELMANSSIFFDLMDRDWALLAAYIAADIDPGWSIKKFQPDTRSMLLKAVADVLSHADTWERECKRRGVATGVDENAIAQTPPDDGTKNL